MQVKTLTKAPLRSALGEAVFCLAGIPFASTTMHSTVAKVIDAGCERRRYLFATPNINFVANAMRDRAFAGAITRCDAALIDGAPLVVAARLLGIRHAERVAGSDLFEEIDQTLRQRNEKLTVFFFGGRTGASEAAHRRFENRTAGFVSVGFSNPGFGDVADMVGGETLNEINELSPSFLVVALGAVKGHAWIERVRGALSVPVISHLGAVVDFAAGGISRAPVWMRRSGLEWLWRIKEEPALWRRYAGDMTALLTLFFLQVLPLALWRATAGRSKEPPSVDVNLTSNATILKLTGAFQNHEVSLLSDPICRAVEAGKPVELDFGELKFIDLFPQGKLLIMKRYLLEQGIPVSIGAAPKSLERALKASGFARAVAL
ncbi:MAG: WecB/TagA/CpsF family glycosyltransferase [Pseudomonadota bacterium]